MCCSFFQKYKEHFSTRETQKAQLAAKSFPQRLPGSDGCYSVETARFITLHFSTLGAKFLITFQVTFVGAVPFFLQKLAVEGAVSGRTVSHCAAELLDLRPDMS